LVRSLFVLIFFISTLYSYRLDNDIISLIGKSNYLQNRGLINILFKDKEKFLKDGHTNFSKVTKVLKENNLINLEGKKLNAIKISFATHQKNSLLFIKLVKEVINSCGYNQFLTNKAIKDESGFLWSMKIRTKSMIDPTIISQELEKRGATIERIKRISDSEYRYDIDIFNAKIDAKKLEANKEIRLKKPLKPYWIDLYKAKSIKISSLAGNNWHPYIVFYDSNLKIIDKYTKERKSYNISLKVPRGTRYIKISDLYTLQNLKRGIKVVLNR